MKQAKQSRKTIKPLKAILIVLCIILLMAILAVCAVGISLAVRYRNHSFEYQPPVERDESDIKTEYEYPDVILDPTPSAGEDVLPQDTETEEGATVSLSYELNSSFAKIGEGAKLSGVAGETLVIPVVSESGVTKTYYLYLATQIMCLIPSV